MAGWKGKDLRKEFEAFHEANPQIYDWICRFAIEAISAGRTQFSIDSIFERIRWEVMVSTVAATDGEERFKMPHNHRAYYARLWLDQHPEHPSFFRTARLRSADPHPVDRFGVEAHAA